MKPAAELPRLAKNNTRMVARDAWFESDCEFSRAIELVDERLRRFVGASFLKPATALAAELLKYWREYGITEPESVFVAGEPGTKERDA